ncbi:MAG TPA: biosynthetic-type acetolactate synthase large subunit [Clostridia bacterium]|nr:MAG: Acetolactate synthase large subunit [Firmicutes bacterium ADurb.Bin146]HOD93666.1 biosynthetic-type acetolactate synthase large subunit [Clostridia bacterium]HQM39902.1 biosynthetic-type acetolactate synthase large subunit [Clostridia bacterium]
MKATGTKVIIETLIEQGCDTVFGYPGGAVLNIYDELYKNSSRIRHIISAHEQGAAHAADAYARVTGKAGVVIATSGPGATNLVTGIANAYLDSSPLIAITGNVALPLLGKDSFQEVDITGITMPITKHNYIVKDVNELADVIREAFMIAQSGRPGPVLIDVPKDVQTAVCEFESKKVQKNSRQCSVTDKQIEQVARLILEAERPYIYCGGGVVISQAGEEIAKLAEKIDSPIGFSMMGLSAVSADNPYWLGMTGMHGRYASTKANSEADLIIAAGVRFSDRATGNKSRYTQNAKVIHIDIDPAEIDKNISAYFGLIGDIKSVLTLLLAKLEKQTHTQWMDKIQQMRIQEGIHFVKDGVMHPKDIIEKVMEYTNADTVVATDVGQHQMWVAQYYKFKKPRTYLTSGGLGTMGFGMGAAIGGCFASGCKKTVLFTGDGSFGMNLNEMATAVTNNLPLVIIIFNNGVLGMVRQWQNTFYDQRYSQTTLNRKTDFVKIAEAFGATGYRVMDIKMLKEALDEAFKAQGPVVIDCSISKDEKVLPMIPPGGSIDNIITR